MKTFTLLRTKQTDHGTFGILISQDLKFTCYTAELPWRNNQFNISCIPQGSYQAAPRYSPRFDKLLYRLSDKQTAPRSAILIHGGNYAGDTAQGLKSDAQGCIILGNGFSSREENQLKQDGLNNSQDAMYRFHQYCQADEITINIIEAY